ncbi:hypothetical protein PHMEG_0007258 [Phytophthora megakarya]|uniref:Uncharacterized protein n=1 Tax=Phytophthora megakarya TaxID=4795 RepID=A0A225WMB8_9STRA|nr:hypothetical protein PHMEG_0007258 [Phytophthora megakarya]
MCDLTKLVMGMARQSPPRVNFYLDQRLNSASTVQEVMTAAVAPHRLPPQEADELVHLRDELSRLQTRCEDAERDLANEVQLRTAAEPDSVRSTEDFYTIHDANQDLRTENEELVARIRELDITVAEQVHGVHRLKDRCRSSDADCAAVMRFVAQERERMKAGLKVYNAELAKLSTRNSMTEGSLRRANSVLRQNSAKHGLNTDALIFSTAGLSASGLDWKLLGLGPDHTGLLWLLPPNSRSEGSVGEGSVPPAAEVSASLSKAPLGSGSSSEGPASTRSFGP